MKHNRKIKTASITFIVFLLIYTEALMKTFQKQNYFSIQSSLVLHFNPTKLISLYQNNYRKSKKESPNFLSKYKYGNKHEKGIKNMHINIRSIRHKLHEIKYIAQSHTPHKLGISETEIHKII